MIVGLIQFFQCFKADAINSYTGLLNLHNVVRRRLLLLNNGLLPLRSHSIVGVGYCQSYLWLISLSVLWFQVVSGITVALVVKYADNILKGFAVSISILISSFVSFYFLNDFEPSLGFFVGTFLVILATFMYGVDFSKKPSLKSSWLKPRHYIV